MQRGGSLKLDMEKLSALAIEAGKAIMEVYEDESGFEVETKDDNSPLTKADKLSHEIIVKGLKELYPDIPVISEEGEEVSFEERVQWNRFWLVDPLDGTKEFIKRNGDFTVNIALIEDCFPVAGVIFAPVKKALYAGEQGKGAFKVEDGSKPKKIKTKKPGQGGGHIVVQSRSHPSEKLAEFLNTIKINDSIAVGSSLKFCMVAEGLADLYPRLAPTWEWDTAAGQAIVEAAGGAVFGDNGVRLGYNKSSLLNKCFIVYA